MFVVSYELNFIFIEKLHFSHFHGNTVNTTVAYFERRYIVNMYLKFQTSGSNTFSEMCKQSRQILHEK